MTDDEARYRRLRPEARALLEDHDAIDLADMLVTARAQLTALRQVARDYCPACGRGDAAPTVEDWERERKRAEQAEAALERVRAIHTHGPRTNTCNDCGQPWPCELTRALDQPAPGPDTTSPAAGLPGWIRNGARDSRVPHITARPVTPEMERAATERAIQAAADNERAREWIAAHSGPTPAEEQRDRLAALAHEILYATHNISSQDWARWRETLDNLTEQQ